MKSKQYIQIKKVKRPDKKAISQQEKIERLYRIARKINVKIGG